MKITKVAVKIGDVVHEAEQPERHHDILHRLYAEGIDHTGNIQGFIDPRDGSFMHRKRAEMVAIRLGQIKKGKWPGGLYSEDLW